MQVSIWQQWASNHGNDFVVVGEFATPAAATTAAEKLHAILTTIAAARAQNGRDQAEPTPAERQLAAEYHLQWDESLAWLTPDTNPAINALDGYVATHGHRIFVSCGPHSTGLGAAPLDQLMSQFTDTLWVEEERGAHKITVNLTCRVPDEDTAHRLYAQAHAYLQAVAAQKGAAAPIPWIAYARGARHPQAAQLQAALTHQLRAESDLTQLKQEIHDLVTTTDAHAAETMAHLHDRYKDTFAAIADYPDHDELFAAWQNTSLGGGTIARTGTTLAFQDLWLSKHLGTGLRAITAWLSDHGCGNIEIELSTTASLSESE